MMFLLLLKKLDLKKYKENRFGLKEKLGQNIN